MKIKNENRNFFSNWCPCWHYWSSSDKIIQTIKYKKLIKCHVLENYL
jgi:hypothetical protein